MLVANGVRHFLFLQGPGSVFFFNLAKSLRKSTVRISKIHLCLGDEIFWRGENATRYRGRYDEWRAYLERYVISNNVSDIVLFSDSRPYHRVAVKVANSLGLNVFVFENGYFRPDWITCELGGVNGRSPFPRTREGVEALAQRSGDMPLIDGRAEFANRLILGDIAFHTLNMLGRPLYRHYRRFRRIHPLAEASGWLGRAFGWRGKQKRSDARLASVLHGDRPFYFFPLQLDHDFQLTVDSSFNSISEACEHVVASFASHAPGDSLLLVKNHPRDNNIVNRERDVARIAAASGVSDRVVFIETGSNPDIFRATRGMVTINSTMGTSGLFHGVPVCALGAAVYDIAGLTHKQGLDSFWTEGQEPDPDFFRQFRNALIFASQIRGEFGTPDPECPGLQACVERLMSTPYRTAGLTVVNPVSAAAKQALESPPVAETAAPAGNIRPAA